MYSGFYRTLKLLWPGELGNRRTLRELEHTQWLSLPDLEAWQFERICRLVQYAYEHVPYYQERYQREGIHPQDIKSLKDFQSLPFLTREDVNNYLDKLVSSSFRGKLYPNETGGSTGQPMRFFIDDSFWRWNAVLLRGRRWHGVQEGDKMAWVWGAQQDLPGWHWKERLKAQITRHRYLNAFSMTEAKMHAFANMLVRWQPAMFRAYASALFLFARFIQEQGIVGIRPRLIETTAEKTTGPQRQLLEQVFDCPVADYYSSRELAAIAYPCPQGQLHVCETRYLEIIAKGQIAQPGQLGEIVITSLHQFAMPFIRYKIGDMGIYNVDPCSCGRGLPVLQEVSGRTHDFLVTADGQFVHGEFFAYLFRLKPEIARYQIYQKDREHLEIRLVLKKDVDSTWFDNIHAEIQAHFGKSVQISLQAVDKIELTSAGKHRYIISEVKPNFV